MVRLRTMSAAALLATVSAFAIAGPVTSQDETQLEIEAPERIVVRGVNIPDEKRDTSEISAVVDASDFQITGDSDVASALQRVTGLSLSRGRFVIVRGLNERYSSATLNGSPLPSPEPLRRVAPLDLFPTDALESVLVQKTYSGEYSLEFGGGLIDLRTKALPEERFLDLSTSIGFNDAITFDDDTLLHDGGDADWTGFDDGARNLPGGIGEAFRFGQLFPSDDATRQAISADFANPSLLVLQSGYSGPNGGINLNAGDRFDLGSNVSLGVITALGYNNSWSARDGVLNDATRNDLPDAESDDPCFADRCFIRERSENEIKTNALVSIGADLFSDHTLKATFLGARSTEKATESRTGIQSDQFEDGREDFTEWYERQMWIGQLAGEHYFPALGDLEVSWRASHSEAFRDVPLNTSVLYRDGVRLDEGFDVAFVSEALKDRAEDIGIDVVLPFAVLGMDGDIKGGWSYRDSRRDTTEREYNFEETALNAVDDLRIDTLITEGELTTVQFQNPNNVPDSFLGTLELDAFYAGIDVQVNPYIRAQLSGRYEDYLQVADAFTRDVPDAPVNQRIEQANSSQYFLPAGTITWNPLEDQQVRFAFSQTIARPQFRELAPQLFRNNQTGLLARGNPLIRQTELTNVDARYEWYFGRDEFITFGAFYKEITDPIVEITATVGDDVETRFINAPAADLQGVEVEFEKSLPIGQWIGGEESRKDFFFGANYTFTDSEVDVDGNVIVFTPGSPAANLAQCSVETTGACSDGNFQYVVAPAGNFIAAGSSLQGQSDHLFNLQFGFDDYEARSQPSNPSELRQ